MKDLRLTFEEDPAVYDRVRPSYPWQLFDDLWRYAGFDGTVRACEIGPGTGKATAALLARGAEVAGVEIGQGMVAFLRAKFAEEPHLTVLHDEFEKAPLDERGFDLVFAATAWHWLNPASRMERAARLLRPGGVLAIVDTNQVASEVDGGYFAASQRIYRKYGEPEPPPTPGPDLVPAAMAELEGSPPFGDVTLRRYRWDQVYSRADYEDLMRTYSGMRARPAAAREALIAELGEFIDSEYEGQVTRPLVVTLAMAKSISAGS